MNTTKGTGDVNNCCQFNLNSENFSEHLSPLWIATLKQTDAIINIYGIFMYIGKYAMHKQFNYYHSWIRLETIIFLLPLDNSTSLALSFAPIFVR